MSGGYSSNGVPWWIHLGGRVGIKSKDWDTLDKDVDPFRGYYDKSKDTYDDIKGKVNKMIDSDSDSNSDYESVKTEGNKLNNIRRKFVGDSIDNNNNKKKMPAGSRLKMALGHGAKNQINDAGGEEEIAVAPIPDVLSNIVPDYFTIKMKMRNVFTQSTTVGGATYTTSRVTLNALNSAFSSATTFDYLGVSQWKSLFQFYRIIANDITVVVKNCTGTGDITTGRIDTAVARVGLEFTDSATARLTDSRQISEGKHNVSTQIDPVDMTDAYTHTFTHHYTPEDFVNTNSHITNNSEEDRWTAIAANASHPHYCHITQTWNQEPPTAGAMEIRYDLTSEITIQFREITDSILTTSQTS